MKVQFNNRTLNCRPEKSIYFNDLFHFPSLNTPDSRPSLNISISTFILRVMVVSWFLIVSFSKNNGFDNHGPLVMTFSRKSNTA